MQLSQLKRLKKLWKYNVNDPGAGSGGGAPSPAPTPAYDPIAGMNGQQAAQMDDAILATLPEVAQKAIRSLRYEAGQMRGKYNAEKEAKESYAAKLAEGEAASRLAQEEELKKQNNFKQLWETQQIETAKETTRLRKLALDAKIEGAALAAGIPAKLHRLIEPSGTSIDANGVVTGVEAAIERFKAENADILAPFQKAPEPQEPAAKGPDGKALDPNDALNMYIPGTQMTFAQAATFAKNMGNVGQDPPARGAQPVKKFDAKTATAAESAERLKKLTGKR
jgi:hypothetical protein